MTRGKKVFKLVEGKSIPFDGEEIIYSKDGITPQTEKEWLAGLAVAVPKFFKPSTGGNATNQNKAGGASPKQISRTGFEAKNAGERMAFVKAGGKIVD